MTTPGDLKGACAAVAAPARPDWRRVYISVSDSPTMIYVCIPQTYSMNYRVNSQRTILSRSDTELAGSDGMSIPDPPIRTVPDPPIRAIRPFPREWIRFMMRGGREGVDVTEIGMSWGCC